MSSPVARFSSAFCLLFALFATLPVALRAQSSTTENVADALVLRVNGDAIFTTAENPETPLPLRRRMTLQEGSTIETGPSSSVSLVFSNGSNITIGADSRIELRKLYQESFEATGSTYGALPSDPSRSETEVFVHHGEVLGEVRGLQSVSRFDVTSAVGTAGIRGTIFQVTINVVDGGIQMLVQNIQGTVIFESTQLSIPQTPIPPETGTEIIAEFDDQTGELTIVESNTVDVPIGRVIQLRTQAREVTDEASTPTEENPSPAADNSGPEATDDEGDASSASADGAEASDQSSPANAESDQTPPVDAQSIIDEVFGETENVEQEVQVGTSTSNQ